MRFYSEELYILNY